MSAARDRLKLSKSAAAAFGRRGGLEKTPAQQAARRRNIAKATEARLAKRRAEELKRAKEA